MINYTAVAKGQNQSGRRSWRICAVYQVKAVRFATGRCAALAAGFPPDLHVDVKAKNNPQCPGLAVIWGLGLSPSQQIHELFNRKSGVGDDAAECAGADLFVVGDNGTGVRFIPAQNHMAACLAAKDEAGAFQGGAYFTAGKISGEFGHARDPFAYAASTSTNSLPDSTGTGSPASRQSSM